MTTFSYDHVGLSVADLDAQRDFYAEAFGLREQSRAEIPAAGTRIAFLRAAGGLQLELVERAGSAPCRNTSALAGAGLQTYFHWALAVADLDEAIATAVTAGAERVSGPARAQRRGIRFAYVRDPEGNLIELVQADAPATGG